MAEQLALVHAIREFLFDDIDDYIVQYLQNEVIVGNAAHFLIMRHDAVPKVLGYAENIIPQYNFDDFRHHFRLSRDVYEQLLQHIAPSLMLENEGGKEGIDPDKQLLIFLWYMGNQDSMREIANLFGISISTVHSIIYRVLDIFMQELAHVSNKCSFNRIGVGYSAVSHIRQCH